jgi:hypothetical protein
VPVAKKDEVVSATGKVETREGGHEDAAQGSKHNKQKAAKKAISLDEFVGGTPEAPRDDSYGRGGYRGRGRGRGGRGGRGGANASAPVINDADFPALGGK